MYFLDERREGVKKIFQQHLSQVDLEYTILSAPVADSSELVVPNPPAALGFYWRGATIYPGDAEGDVANAHLRFEAIMSVSGRKDYQMPCETAKADAESVSVACNMPEKARVPGQWTLTVTNQCGISSTSVEQQVTHHT